MNVVALHVITNRALHLLAAMQTWNILRDRATIGDFLLLCGGACHFSRKNVNYFFALSAVRKQLNIPKENCFNV
jgi:hypothetical protein